jgi:GT2 family glycosyltransferase
VGHGPNAFGAVSYFGPTPADCELLDGLFIAANASALRERGVKFDERFDFHFYDMDFCRSTRAVGLRLGTWPICLSHQSVGALGTPGWSRNYAAYLNKWGS